LSYPGPVINATASGATLSLNVEKKSVEEFVIFSEQELTKDRVQFDSSSTDQYSVLVSFSSSPIPLSGFIPKV